MTKYVTTTEEMEILELEARIYELKKAFDVDTIPGIPVKPCGDCIGIYEYTQDRLAELTTQLQALKQKARVS